MAQDSSDAGSSGTSPTLLQVEQNASPFQWVIPSNEVSQRRIMAPRDMRRRAQIYPRSSAGAVRPTCVDRISSSAAAVATPPEPGN
jgi:hypothetical protein